MHKIRFCLQSASLAVALVITGCGGGGTPAPAGASRVRILNAIEPSATETGVVTVSNGGQVFNVGGLNFGQWTPGTDVFPQGFTPLQSPTWQPTILESDGAAFTAQNGFALANDGGSYTVVLTGISGQSIGGPGPQALVLPPFAPSQAIPTGSAAVRLVDAVPDFGQTFTLTSTSAPLGLPNTLANVGYDYSTYQADYAFSVLPVNVLVNLNLNSSAGGTLGVTFATNSLANFQFQTGRAYTILVYGSQTGTTTLNALVIQDYPIQG